jgi:hypothetical protein
MAIDINYNVKGLDPLTAAIETLISKFDSLGGSLNTSFTDNNFKEMPRDSDVNAVPQANSPNSLFVDTLNKTSASFNGLNARLEKLTGEFEKMNRSLNSANNENAEENNSKNNNQKNNNGETAAERRKKDNFIKYFATGAMLGAGQQIGNFAGTVGSSAGALNSGYLNYANFETQYANKKISNEQSAMSGLGALAMGGAAMMPKASLLTRGILAGGGAALNVLANYFGEKDKALNEQNRQDTLAYRLSNAGMDTMSGKSILGNVGITKTQEQSLTNQYSAYDPTLGDVTFAARRDIANRMIKNSTANDFNMDVNKFSMLSGNQNVTQISGVASQMSAMTGEPLNVVMKQMNDNFTKWGGDTAGNTAKMLEIMKSTGMSQGQASDIVNRYQYNDPMLQNKVNFASADPVSRLNKAILMSIPGVADADIHAAQIAGDKINPDKNFILAQLKMQAGGYTNENMLATHLADMMPESAVTGNMQPTPLQEQNQKNIQDALKNLTVTNQNVSATTVYLSGVIKENASAIGNKTKNFYGIPKTGASQPLYVVHHRKINNGS